MKRTIREVYIGKKVRNPETIESSPNHIGTIIDIEEMRDLKYSFIIEFRDLYLNYTLKGVKENLITGISDLL